MIFLIFTEQYFEIETDTWVAVIYEGGDWYIGKVVKKLTEDNAVKVKFLQQKRVQEKNIFGWPSIKDVQVVAMKFVLCKDVQVSELGRVFNVPQYADIEEAQKYVEIYDF